MPAELSSSVRATKAAILGKSTTLQSAAVATGAGTVASPKTQSGTIFVDGTFVGTIKIEVSFNNTAFYQVGSDITAAGLVAFTTAAPFMRARISAYTSGSITATLFE